MKAEDIRSADDLEAWLNGLPEEQVLQIAPQIAHRAALRLLPVWAAYWSNFNHETTSGVSVFRCHLLCAVALHDRDADLDFEMFNAKSNWQAAASHAVASFKHVAARDSNHPMTENSKHFAKVASKAAEHAGISVSIVRRVIRSEATIVFSAAKLGAAEAALMADIAAWERGCFLLDRPLFPPENDAMQRTWADAAPLFERHPAWQVFKDLYENSLHAHPQNWPLLIALAQKDEAFWTGTDKQVLDRIAGVMEEFSTIGADQGSPNLTPDEIIDRALQDRPSSTTSEIGAVKQAISATRSELPATFDAVLGMISLELDRLQTINFTSDEHQEICVQQIKTLSVIFRAIERIRDAVPDGVVEDKDAEKILSLGRVFANQYMAWPRQKVKHIVDTSWNFALTGGCSAVLLGLGLPTPVVAATAGAAFFAPRTMKVLLGKGGSK